MIYEHPDRYGNKFYLITGKPAEVKLQLKGKRPKSIAKYDFDSKTLWLKRNSARHYHYVSKSYGFSNELFNLLDIEYVNLQIDREFFRIPRQVFANMGKYLNFQAQGYELQVFLKVEIIRKYAVLGL
jgi:hypothetical protein